MTWPTKDPEEILDYSIDVSSLIGDDDEVSSVSWDLVHGDDLTIGDSYVLDGHAVVWLSGGTANRSYLLELTVVTTGGSSGRPRTYSRTQPLVVRDR